MKYTIWDKLSPINGVDAKQFMKMMGYSEDDEVYIIENDENIAWITQTFKNSPYEGKTIEEKAKNHLLNLDIQMGAKPKYNDLLDYYNTTKEVMK